MDLDLSVAEKLMLQQLNDVVSSCSGASPESSIGGFDAPLLRALGSAGFLSFAEDGPHGRIQAMLVTQEVSKANGGIPIGLQAMLGPLISAENPSQLIAAKQVARPVPIRFVEQAELLVVLDSEQAHVYKIAPGQTKPEKTNYGYPFGRFLSDSASESIGVWPAELVRRRWQLGLAGEIAGAMSGALEHLIAYLSRRQQFGRKIGAFQAIQHRLAELAVTLEAVRYLSLHAAWADTGESAAIAACYAADAARKMCLEAHQLSGAQGFSIKSGLYAWTLRLQSLSVEAGGARWHAAVAASEAWGTADDRHQALQGGDGSYQHAFAAAQHE